MITKIPFNTTELATLSEAMGFFYDKVKESVHPHVQNEGERIGKLLDKIEVYEKDARMLEEKK